MTHLRSLYQQVIMDHNTSPRHYGKQIPGHSCLGKNPICGDQYVLTVHLVDDHIADITFQGEGCAISKASASTMMEVMMGKPIADADTLISEFVAFLTREEEVEHADPRLAVFHGVRDFPARVKCATLAWHTLHDCLHGTYERIES